MGIQAVIANNTTVPPAACFGARTTVLCADGTRKAVADFTGTEHVLAFPNASDDADYKEGPVPIAVRAYWRNTVVHQEMIGQVHPGVYVTKDHLVAVRGKPRPADMEAPPCCMRGPYAHSCWLAKDMLEFQTSADLDLDGVYHLVPCDPDQRLFVVLVGDGEPGSCVAELYRSDESTLQSLNHFYPM